MNSLQNAMESTKAFANDWARALPDRSTSWQGMRPENAPFRRTASGPAATTAGRAAAVPPKRRATPPRTASGPSSFWRTTGQQPQPPQGRAAPRRFRGALKKLTVKEESLRQLLDQEGGLEALKQSLKQQGAVTNTLCKQGLHFYLKDHCEKGNATAA